jgi:hypothetical protein
MVASGIVIVTVLSVLYAVWRSPHRDALAAFGGFAATIIVALPTWVATAKRISARAGEVVDRRKLDACTDALADQVEQEWMRAAGERGLRFPEPIPVSWGQPKVAVTGPLEAAVHSRTFDPLPGLPRVDEQRLVAGQVDDLHAIYGGLGSGRLIITGPVGSGKSGAAVLLILAALRHRAARSEADRAQIPVPLLLTSRDWDPDRQQVGDWLAGQMCQNYGLFAGRHGAAQAAALVSARRVSLILDGLDEMAAELRPVAMRALSQQANFRLVVLSRTAEASSGASDGGMLDGAAALELRPVNSVKAAKYLASVQLNPPPAGWEDLVGRLRDPTNSIAQALNSPLALTLVRDTYRAGDDVRELLDFCDKQQTQVATVQITADVTDHLLLRVLPALYASQRGQKARWDLRTAQRALENIAWKMNIDRSRDLQWWRLPEWVPNRSRALLKGLVAGLILAGLGIFAEGIFFGLVFGVLGWLFFSLIYSERHATPKRIGKLRFRRLMNWEYLILMLAIGLLFGPLVGIESGLGTGLEIGYELAFGLVFGLVFGIVIGLVVGLVVGIVSGFSNALNNTDEPSPLSPLSSWRSDRNYAMVVGGVLGVFFAALSGLAGGGVAGLGLGLAVGLLAFLSISASCSVSIASFQLAWRLHTPVRLMKFLDDAHSRGVLRIVGQTYQFRHARLQDLLASERPAQHTANSQPDCAADLGE